MSEHEQQQTDEEQHHDGPLTVSLLHQTLSEMIAEGKGDWLVAVNSGLVGGSQPYPVEKTFAGGVKPGDGRQFGRRDKATEDGEGLFFLQTPKMLPVGFWDGFERWWNSRPANT